MPSTTYGDLVVFLDGFLRGRVPLLLDREHVRSLGVRLRSLLYDLEWRNFSLYELTPLLSPVGRAGDVSYASLMEVFRKIIPSDKIRQLVELNPDPGTWGLVSDIITIALASNVEILWKSALDRLERRVFGAYFEQAVSQEEMYQVRRAIKMGWGPEVYSRLEVPGDPDLLPVVWGILNSDMNLD